MDTPPVPSRRPDSRARLAELIEANGCTREEERIKLRERIDGEEEAATSNSFAADLVMREEGGFEIWLGSLDDALSLEALRTRGLDAFLNCAAEECDLECASFRRPIGGRSRSHARGASASTDRDVFTCATATGGRKTLAADQIKAVASFDNEWYSDVLGYDTAYLSIPADDSDGYPMDQHFGEATSFLGQCRRDGRKVLVHCIMGINRSSAALVAFLCNGLGMSLEEAIGLTSRQRGHILSNASFLDQLVGRFGQGVPKAVEAGSGDAANSGVHEAGISKKEGDDCDTTVGPEEASESSVEGQ